MPILDKDKIKVYRAGDAVTATVINDTIDTAIHAREQSGTTAIKASEAVIRSSEAKSIAEGANAKSGDALAKSAVALENSEKAEMLSATAESKASIAVATVRELEERANSGAFDGKDGRDGSVASAEGMFGFEILNGHLMLSYYGDTEPDVAIVNGELILNL